MEHDGIAVSCGRLGGGPVVTMTNDVGGTTELPAGRYKVKIVGGFTDAETGKVIHARLVDPAQVEIARKTGSVHRPGWKIPKLPEGRVRRAVDTMRTFDPEFVIFHAFRDCWFPGAAE